MTETVTTITPGAFVRIGQQAVLGADAMQIILYRTKRADYPLDWAPTLAKLRPLAFCRNKAGLQREITEHGLVLTATGRNIVEGLDAAKAVKPSLKRQEEAKAGRWLDG